jgi:hypothetical protein
VKARSAFEFELGLIPSTLLEPTAFHVGSVEMLKDRLDRVVAKHEAGHVIVGLVCGLLTDRVSINSNGGRTWGRSCDGIKSLEEFSDAPLFELVCPCADDFTAEEVSLAAKLRITLYAQTIQALAGSQSELLFFPERTPMLAASDVQRAAKYAKLVASDLKAAAALLDYARIDAERILAARRHQVEAIAAALLKERTLDAEQIEAVISGRPDVLRRKQWTAMAASAELFMTMTGGGLKLLTI